MAAIKAQDDYNKLKDWKHSPTVLQAQRALNKAENDLDVTQQKLKESEMLYKRGIIPAGRIPLLEGAGAQPNHQPLHPQGPTAHGH